MQSAQERIEKTRTLIQKSENFKREESGIQYNHKADEAYTTEGG